MGGEGRERGGHKDGGKGIGCESRFLSKMAVWLFVVVVVVVVVFFVV